MQHERGALGNGFVDSAHLLHIRAHAHIRARCYHDGVISIGCEEDKGYAAGFPGINGHELGIDAIGL